MANGLPNLLNNPLGTVNAVSLLVADAALIYSLFNKPQWGVYLNGSPAIIPDSIVGVEYKHDWRNATAPQGQGAFADYNKVQTPFEARVTMTKGGPIEERQAFLTACEAAAGSLDLYTIVTPEISYQSANITHYDYRRTSHNGVTMLTVDLWLEEVRVTGTVAYANTQQASWAGQVSDGTVQPQTPTPAQAATAQVAPSPPDLAGTGFTLGGFVQ